MFGRKKPDKNEKGAEKKRIPDGDLAAMFGLQMPDDEDDADFEAEPAALQGHPCEEKIWTKERPSDHGRCREISGRFQKDW